MIGNKLISLLEERNIKSGTLAAMTGVPKSTIYSIIRRNNRNVDFEVVQKISDALDVPVSYFFSDRVKDPPASFDLPARAEFKDRLNNALNYRGMTPAELSRKTGIGEGAISQYRRGAYKASQDNLDKISKALDVPVAWLIGNNEAVLSLSFPNNLRNLRKAAGLTLKELGEVIGVAESTVSQYETGKRQPDFDTLLKISKLFNVSTDSLLKSIQNEISTESTTQQASRIQIGKRIEMRRLALGKTIDDVAAEIGVAKSTISRYEHGAIGKVKLPVIAAIARALNVDTKWLTGEKSPPLIDSIPIPDADAPKHFGSISEKIRFHRKKLGLTQTELGSRLGVQKNAVSKWETGRVDDIPMGKIKRLSEIFGVSISYLVDDEDNSTASSSMILSRRVVRIPVLGRIPAGIPIEAIEDVIDFEEIPAAKTSGGRIYFALQVEGDSMFPRFLPGDIVIVRKTEICESGDVCVVYVNGSDATLKEVRLDPEKRTLTIIPANTNYLPRTFSAEEIELLPVRIGGVVEELRRRTVKS